MARQYKSNNPRGIDGEWQNLMDLVEFATIKRNDNDGVPTGEMERVINNLKSAITDYKVSPEKLDSLIEQEGSWEALVEADVSLDDLRALSAQNTESKSGWLGKIGDSGNRGWAK